MATKSRRKVNQHTAQRKVAPITLSWDMGATGIANSIGLVVEDRGEVDAKTGKRVNPNGVKGVRRIDMLEYYHRQGIISHRGHNAGCALRNAWEDTMRAPGWNDNDRVQSSPKPDHQIAIQIDRVSKLHNAWRKVPREHAAMIEHIAIDRGSISGVRIKGVRPYLGANNAKGKEMLGIAFEDLADAMGC